jgi:hypothetical protein
MSLVVEPPAAEPSWTTLAMSSYEPSFRVICRRGELMLSLASPNAQCPHYRY